jgi:hypothetical protein
MIAMKPRLAKVPFDTDAAIGGIAPSSSPETPKGADAKRMNASAWRLLGDAVGPPRRWAERSLRIAQTAVLWAHPRALSKRLGLLRSRGLAPVSPTRAQLWVAGLDMLRLFIVPGARDYYEQRGIDFRFHQLLRVIEDPVSMIDPVGLFSRKETIIGHVLQVVHADPIYDLQLLQMFEDGLDDLETQTQAMISGTHPRAATIGAIVEDTGYHPRLLEYVRAYRRDPETPHLRRTKAAIANDPAFARAEETFATLPGFLNYAASLPRSLPKLVRHALRRGPLYAAQP